MGEGQNSHRSYLLIGLNIFISFYNYTSIQIYMMIIQAMGLERKLKAYKVLLPPYLLIGTDVIIEISGDMKKCCDMQKTWQHAKNVHSKDSNQPLNPFGLQLPTSVA